MSKDIPKEYHHYLDIQSQSILQGGGAAQTDPARILGGLLPQLFPRHLRYGGSTLYRRSQTFFLGLIAGQMFCNGAWQVADYFTGKTGNSIFGF